MKIVPDDPLDPDFDSLAVTARVCQNPVIALNNLLELSSTINVDTLQREGDGNPDFWYGEDVALARLEETGCSTLSPLTEDVYHACGNTAALHIQTGDRAGAAQCTWDWDDPRINKTIAIWFGFDNNGVSVCDGQGLGGLMPASSLTRRRRMQTTDDDPLNPENYITAVEDPDETYIDITSGNNDSPCITMGIQLEVENVVVVFTF